MDWKIRSRSNQCHACATPFDAGAIYHTLLFAEREEHRRIDVCQACWDAQYGHGASDRKGFISHWSGSFQVPPPPPPEPIQRQTAEVALQKLIECNQPELASVCFILATMLERKRLLKVRETIRLEHSALVYEHLKTGDVFTIPDPKLKLDELAPIQKDVAFLLEEGVDAFLERRIEKGTKAIDSQ